VAGGIPSGMGVFESLLKESMEEASLDGDIVRKHAKFVGAVSYCLRLDSTIYSPIFRSGHHYAFILPLEHHKGGSNLR
jgi:hypothetical protein